MNINYAIPPLTPAEALEWIERSEEHQFGHCSDGYDACDCAQRFVGVVLGRPGYHGHPKEARKPRSQGPVPSGRIQIDLRSEANAALAAWKWWQR